MEYIKCNHRKCNKPLPPNKPSLPEGFYYDIVLKNNINYYVAKECPDHIKWREEKELLKRFKKSGFTGRFYNTEFYLDENHLDKINNYIKNPTTFLYIYHKDFSSRETGAAAFLGKKILSSGLSCNTILMTGSKIERAKGLIALLQESNTNEKVRENMEFLLNSDILIIRNSFSDGASQWGNYLESFLLERISQEKGIIFLSSTPIIASSLSNRGYSNNIQNIMNYETKKSFISLLDSDFIEKEEIGEIFEKSS